MKMHSPASQPALEQPIVMVGLNGEAEEDMTALGSGETE